MKNMFFGSIIYFCLKFRGNLTVSDFAGMPTKSEPPITRPQTICIPTSKKLPLSTLIWLFVKHHSLALSRILTFKFGRRELLDFFQTLWLLMNTELKKFLISHSPCFNFTGYRSNNWFDHPMASIFAHSMWGIWLDALFCIEHFLAKLKWAKPSVRKEANLIAFLSRICEKSTREHAWFISKINILFREIWQRLNIILIRRVS